jgi:hypothetical protein
MSKDNEIFYAGDGQQVYQLPLALANGICLKVKKYSMLALDDRCINYRWL